MADHYYTVNPNSAHDEWQISANVLGNDLTFTTDAGVFSRDGLDRGTEVMLNALPELSGRILDLGCGWGAVGVSLGKKYPALEILMTDINQRAVDLSNRNLAANGVTNAHAVQGDAFENVEGLFDAVITNPPIRAGKAVIYAMFDEARKYLVPGGSLYIVIRKQQGAPSALKYLSTIYDSAETIDRGSGFHVIRAVHQGN
ncbi:MAG: class I SAM-dependent methyltransferase [Clostridiales bacterium]|nr:class I SAM-dependent methyltransferase [Clostridiales bacterium]